MCLARVEKNYNKTSNRIHLGHKFFYKQSDGQLRFEYFYVLEKNVTQWLYLSENRKIVPQGRWITATSEGLGEIKPQIGHYYRPGFHIYKTKEDLHLAGKSNPTEVLFRNVTAKGLEQRGIWTYQDDTRQPQVLVAQEMYVPIDEEDLKRELKKHYKTIRGRWTKANPKQEEARANAVPKTPADNI